ncbi:MAG: cysteine desulfurase / selenocysteine [Planctomycetota bacterium]|nr:MAG: cysteine desulfurase / selenocysteine [Planctomycetota bacterium]
MKAVESHGSKVEGAVIDWLKVRNDFPALRQQVRGKPLVYLDNAATSQKPQVVIDAVREYYEQHNANIHRGVHWLSEQATIAYEGVRKKVARFINAADPRECVFVRGATEGINLVAQTFGRRKIGKGDEILLSALEHHSNIVPWQLLCEEKGATIRVIPMNDAGELLVDEFAKLLSPRTKLVAVTHVSNALGTITPIKRIASMAKLAGVTVLVDGAQAVPHQPVDVHDIGADFYIFSGHKMCAPTGIGVAWAPLILWDSLPPWQGGGDMISSVSFEKSTWAEVPAKFEAGTPHIEGVVGLGAAIDYLAAIGMDRIAAREKTLLQAFEAAIRRVPGTRLVGTAKEKAGVASFVMEGIHPHDIGTIADQEGVALRTGHHCAQPVMTRLGLAATARASVAFYNTPEEALALESAIRRVSEVFGA